MRPLRGPNRGLEPISNFPFHCASITINFEIFAVCVVTKYKAIKARVLGRKAGNCKCANLPSFAFVAMAYIHNDDEQINNRPPDAMCAARGRVSWDVLPGQSTNEDSGLNQV